MPPLEHCVETVTHSNVVVSERGKTACFRNPSRSEYRKVQIDGCVIEEGVRADWIVQSIGMGCAIIELKGRDLGHACDQLFETFFHANCQQFLEERVVLVVVTSRRPRYNTQTARASEKARRHGVKLKIVCERFDCSLESVL